MKKIISLALCVCMAMFYASNLFGQEDTAKSSNSDEPEIQQAIVVKKKIPELPLYFGFQFGEDYCYLKGNSSNDVLDGLNAGVVVDVRLLRHCYLETSLLYAEAGGSNINFIQNGTLVNYEAKWNMQTIELPIIINYSIGNALKLFIGAGGYVAYNISGISNPTDDYHPSSHLKIGSSPSDDIKAIDYGIRGKLKVNFGIVFVCFGAQYGIANLQPQEGSNVNNINTFSYFTGLGMMFHKRSKPTKYKHLNLDNNDPEMKM